MFLILLVGSRSLSDMGAFSRPPGRGLDQPWRPNSQGEAVWGAL